MANKITGRKAASAASKVLRSSNTSKNAKTAAGSALSQREVKRRKYPCPSCGSGKVSPRGKCPACGYTG